MQSLISYQGLFKIVECLYLFVLMRNKARQSIRDGGQLIQSYETNGLPKMSLPTSKTLLQKDIAKIYNCPLIYSSLPRNMAAIIIVVKGDVKSKVMASPRGIKVMQLTAQVTITPPKMPVFITFLNLNFQSNFFVQFDFFTYLINRNTHLLF